MDTIPSLVSTEWLDKNRNRDEVRILDASWYLPNMQRDAKAEFKAQHIPGAQFFDIDEISDSFSELPHMAPDLEKFVSRSRKLGISDGTKVIIYDGVGVFSAARVWWLFQLFNKFNVAVLDGGLPKWIAEAREVTDATRAPKDRHLTLSRRPNWVKTVSEVAEASKLGKAKILDARAPARFAGEAPEPRAGLRAGHIPNSQNLFFKDLLNDDNTFKSKDELLAIFDRLGVSNNDDVITSCGSGVTAAIISLALDIVGHESHSLYDGSWAEWGSLDLLPIETGAA